ncbi:MAG: helix-turn-helix domain-containing protein [Clostridia bacterium]|nr:helix-turn-helix domain-containing protein [Clostridia bacterium]
MNLSNTGTLICALRKEKGLTQKDVADKLGICAKTVSKWETGHGFPDISLITELSKIFQVDISNLLEGKMPETKKAAGQIKHTKFYVCEKCGNVITSLGNADVLCCGRKMAPLVAQSCDELHQLKVEKSEDDYYITFNHPMTKEHYISFVSYVRFDRVLIIKLYPEQASEVRFPQMRGGKLYYCCNLHGLFEIKI